MRPFFNTVLRNAVLPASLFFGMAYWRSCQDASDLAKCAKVASTALLALHGHKTFQSLDAKQKVGSLIFHSLGDLLIELPNQFLPAISIFLTGHAFYISTLLKDRIPLSEVGLQRGLLMAGFGFLSVAFTRLIVLNTVGVIQCAIPFYSLGLTAMFMLSCLQKENALRRGLTGLGYVGSDMLIAYHMFVEKIPGFNYVSWPLYYAAQALVATEESSKKNAFCFTDFFKIPTIDVAECSSKKEADKPSEYTR